MKKVIFTQDIGVPRKQINELLLNQNLASDWSLADNIEPVRKNEVVAICTANKPLSKSFLEAFPNLKIVAMSFTGYDHVDKNYCTSKGISVYNVPSYSTDSVAELAIGLAISLLRQIPKGCCEVREGRWNENLSGLELAGKKCGIIGTGTIGLRLAEILKVFNCDLYGWSRSKKDFFQDLGGNYVELNEIFSICDIIFVSIALNEETTNLINKTHFELIKTSAYLINVARGPVINRSDLIEAISNNKFKGLALDVYDYEPLNIDDELRYLPNTILTPHVAYRTQEALERKATVTVQNIMRGLNDEAKNRVI